MTGAEVAAIDVVVVVVVVVDRYREAAARLEMIAAMSGMALGRGVGVLH